MTFKRNPVLVLLAAAAMMGSLSACAPLILGDALAIRQSLAQLGTCDWALACSAFVLINSERFFAKRDAAARPVNKRELDEKSYQ